MKLTLTQHNDGHSLVAWNEQANITHAQFLADVMHVAEHLPNKQYAINLCEDRYHFMVSFAAIIVKGQTNLLPQNRVIETLYAVAEDYNDSYCITEEKLTGLKLTQLDVSELFKKENKFTQSKNTIKTPAIDSELIAAIAFTSGSTGKPQGNSKTWKALVMGAEMAAERFGLDKKPTYIVSTVPPQHMYGLETSILYSLQNTCPVYAGRPFYPEDIRRVTETAPQAVILITTPIHLRACAASENLQWNNIGFIISATAPLRNEVAMQVEDKMRATVKEIFGCTEVGSMASRETLKEQIWQLYKGIRIYQADGKAYIDTPYMDKDIALNDVVKIEDEHHFKLLGRDEDMVNVAGKRGSLSDLKLKLESIEGVDDAVVYLPEDNNEISRLTAFVVTENLTPKQISAELAQKVDSVFIPRPIYKVKSLPYNKTGKLTRQSLIELSCQCKFKIV
ncbi:FIGfam138462: Acyl-CoA synthetase, AMP-(fatty) acid ligase [hydrothermal vent metagenome]|uniref:FIGfam138462: Acyl-CoA synthetase, AMP-(Fatty) acid ligase n=1 Tax=hydrothermal vent metagenome TaxID=652676 RepID=A0A3B0ZYT5_9ZZZZ